MNGPDPIDLLHKGVPRSVGCYVLDTDDGPALFDCGPAVTIPTPCLAFSCESSATGKTDQESWVSQTVYGPYVSVSP